MDDRATSEGRGTGFVTPPGPMGGGTSRVEGGVPKGSRSIGSGGINIAPPEVIVETPNLTDIGTPGLDEAIANLGEFEYDFDPRGAKAPGGPGQGGPEEEGPAATAPQGSMVFSPQAVAPLPTLRTEAWPHTGQKPTPTTMVGWHQGSTLVAHLAQPPPSAQAPGVAPPQVGWAHGLLSIGAQFFDL